MKDLILLSQIVNISYSELKKILIKNNINSLGYRVIKDLSLSGIDLKKCIDIYNDNKSLFDFILNSNQYLYSDVINSFKSKTEPPRNISDFCNFLGYDELHYNFSQKKHKSIKMNREQRRKQKK